MDHLCYFFLVIVMLSCASAYRCLVVTCWEMADLLAPVCEAYCEDITPGSGMVLDCIDS